MSLFYTIFPIIQHVLKKFIKNSILITITAFAAYGVLAGVGFIENGQFLTGIVVSLLSYAWLYLFAYANGYILSDEEYFMDENDNDFFDE